MVQMKNSHVKFSAVLAICTAILSGCSTGSAVMASSGGAYTITKSGTTGFTPLGVLRKEAYEEANNFAASKGMVAEVISVNEVPAGFARWPQVDLRFRLASAAARDRGVKEPTVSVSTQASHDAMGNRVESETNVSVAKNVDFYAEMKQLGELKEKGLLTEEEFQKEKKRLLDARDK